MGNPECTILRNKYKLCVNMLSCGWILTAAVTHWVCHGHRGLGLWLCYCYWHWLCLCRIDIVIVISCVASRRRYYNLAAAVFM